MAIAPWGTHAWLLPKIGPRAWGTIACASFEDRCIGSAEIAVNNNARNNFHLIRIDDPPSRFSEELRKLVDANSASITLTLGSAPMLHSSGLMATSPEVDDIVKSIRAESVLLDITCLPKRYFLFIVKRLLVRPDLRDLVVLYTRPKKYREGPLSENANPLAPLPGFSRTILLPASPTVVIGVGYVSFDINDLVVQTKGLRLKALFPFPPGSPAARRNWRLLKKLVPDSDKKLEIQRVHALDAFGALDYLKIVREEADGWIDMVPLGPKPHALAMGLAAIDSEGSQIIYAQPKTYRPDYSSGIRRLPDGSPETYAYCLRRNGIDYWR